MPRDHRADTWTIAGSAVTSTLIRAVLVLGERPPERGPLGDDRGGVARGGLPLAAALPPGLLDDLADRALHRRDVVEEAAVAQRLGVDAQRGQRRPQPVGQVGDALPFARQQVVDARRQPVQAVAGAPDLLRPGDRGPCRQVAAGQAVRRERQRGQRPDQRTGQLVRHDDAEQQQEGPDAEQQQPRPGDAVAQHRVRDEGADHRGPAGQPFHRDEHLDPARHGCAEGLRRASPAGRSATMAPAPRPWSRRAGRW